AQWSRKQTRPWHRVLALLRGNVRALGEEVRLAVTSGDLVLVTAPSYSGPACRVKCAQFPLSYLLRRGACLQQGEACQQDHKRLNGQSIRREYVSDIVNQRKCHQWYRQYFSPAVMS